MHPQTQRKALQTVLCKHVCRAWGWVRTGIRAGCGVCQRLSVRASRFCQAQTLRLVGVVEALRTRVRRSLSTGWRRLWMLRPLALPLLIALAFSAIASVAGYHAGPWLAASLSGVGGFSTALAMQIGLRLRSLIIRLSAPIT